MSVSDAAQNEPWAPVLCAAAALAAVLVFKRAKARRVPEAPEISSRGSKLLRPTLPCTCVAHPAVLAFCVLCCFCVVLIFVVCGLMRYVRLCRRRGAVQGAR